MASHLPQENWWQNGVDPIASGRGQIIGILYMSHLNGFYKMIAIENLNILFILSHSVIRIFINMCDTNGALEAGFKSSR